MIIHEVVCSPTSYIPRWSNVTGMVEEYADWTDTQITLTVTAELWELRELCIPILPLWRTRGFPKPVETDLPLTQELIDKLPSLKVSEKQVEWIQELYDRHNEPLGQCCCLEGK